MSIFKNFFIGALLLVAVNAQNVHAMKPEGGQNYDLNKLTKEEIRNQRLQYFQRLQNQGAGNQQHVQPLPATIPNTIILDETDQSKKRKQEETDDQQPAKKQKLNDNQSMEIDLVATVEQNSDAKDSNTILNDPLWLADQEKLFNFNPAHIDCVSSSVVPDTQVLIFIFTLQDAANKSMSKLMERLSDLATVCKCWHNVIFSQPQDLIKILEKIWVLGKCQSMDILHYCATRGFARASKLCLYKLAGVDEPSKGKILSIQDTDKLFNACTKMSSFNATSIFSAAQGGCLALVDFLATSCGHNIDFAIDIPNNNGKTPLLCAAEKGHFFIVAYLESQGAQLDVCDIDKKTLLHHAVLSGDQNLIKFAFNKGKNINVEGLHNQKDKHNKLALHYAAQKGDLNTVHLLTADGSHEDVLTCWKDKCPLMLAIENGHLVVAQYLYGLANNSFMIPPHYSLDLKKQVIRNGTIAMLSYLYEIAGKESWDDDMVDLLMLAFDHKKEDMVVFMLKQFKSNVDILNEKYKRNERTIISRAIQTGNEEIITLLLDAGVKVTNEDLKWKPMKFSDELEQKLNDATSYFEKIKGSLNNASECIIS